MSRLEKAIERLNAHPPEADFADVRALLEAYGWTQARQKGSHVSFTKSGERSITVPLHDRARVKRRYAEEVIRRLGLEE